jgi:hypothetical protein
MAYPRRCAGCAGQYENFTGQGESTHVTLAAQDGGTASPWATERPGRILDLGCKMCGAIYRWDYFAPAADGRLGSFAGLLRAPVAGWSREVAFSGRTISTAAYDEQRRAS